MEGITKIYVVYAEQGEYSDWRCWDIIAYPYREQAEHHASAAAARHEEERLRVNAADGSYAYSNPFDSAEGNQCGDYMYADERKYGVYELDLFAHFDLFQEAKKLV